MTGRALPLSHLEAENAALRRRLAEAEATIRALVQTTGLDDGVSSSGLPRGTDEESSPRGRLFRAIFEGVDDGILLLDSHGVFLDANPAACSLLGVPKVEIIGRRTEDFAAPGYDAGLERRKITEQGRRRGVLQIRLPDNALRELDYRASRDILPGLHLSVIRDVTELNRARNALVASEKRYRQIVDTAREGIWLIDSHEITVFANRALEEMLGYAPGEMLGKSIYEFVHREEWGNTKERLNRRRAGVAERVDQRYVHRDGSAVWTVLEASPMTDETGSYSGALAMMTNVTERRRTEEALRASEERYRLLFESSPLPIWLTDVDSQRFIAVNGAALELFGYDREEFLNSSISSLLSVEEARRIRENSNESSALGIGYRYRKPKRKDGTSVELNVMTQTFLLDGRWVALVIAQDLTQKLRLEAQLAQSRKLEAIGILAGGVAHDFNNLLSIIITYTTFALESLAPGDSLRADIEQVGKAADRAALLTRQLLAFGRRQILEPTLLDLNATVGALVPMLRRLVGENIDLTLHTEPLLGHVSADAGQIQQVIMNLVVNARDAMPGGGELTIETANFTASNRLGVGPLGLKAGAHVKLTVSDSGSGIDEATRERIFEPFFTTKEQGKGTGLGLSTVLGIVEQSGGKLEVQSELGKGTRFMVYLPQVARLGGAAPVHSLPPPVGAPTMGSETILVVEDDEQVRTLTRSILRRHGYHVLLASNPGEAFLISEQHPGPIELLLTDVLMPRMNGRQLAERLAPARPDMKVLFMTGYTDDAVVRQGVLDADIALLQKPITPDALARRVRSVLDEVRPVERGT